MQLVVLGFVMRLDVLAFLAALAWPFVILLGLMMAVLLLGALVGWPLMWATVSVEGTDAFDALSRSYAYTYHRPWRLLWYVVFAGFLAVASMFVVKLFASSAIALGNWSIGWGLDEPTMHSVVAPRPLQELSPAPPAIEVVPGSATPEKAAAPAATPEPPRELVGLPSATNSIINFWKSLVAAVGGRLPGWLPLGLRRGNLSAPAARYRRRANERSLRRSSGRIRHAAADRRPRDRRARSCVELAGPAGRHTQVNLAARCKIASTSLKNWPRLITRSQPASRAAASRSSCTCGPNATIRVEQTVSAFSRGTNSKSSDGVDRSTISKSAALSRHSSRPLVQRSIRHAR